MSAVETLLAEVLAEHQVARTGGETWGCLCSRVLANTRHDAAARLPRHLAAEQAKALREWLTSDETLVEFFQSAWDMDPTASDIEQMHDALADLIGADR